MRTFFIALAVPTLMITGRCLLVYAAPNSEQRGLFIDAQGKGIEFVGAQRSQVGAIAVPASFNWRQTDAGYVPDYGF